MRKTQRGGGAVKNWLIVLIAAAVLGIAAAFCILRLEIVDDTEWHRPGREVRENPYLAFDRWLASQGMAPHIVDQGYIDTVLDAEERIVFIETSRFYAMPGDVNELTEWVRGGGRLVLSINTEEGTRWLTEYLSTLGITVNYNAWMEAAEAGTDAGEEEEVNEDVFNIPFDFSKSFAVVPTEGVGSVRVIREWNGKTMLVCLEIGEGSVTVLGEAFFLHNYSLAKEDSAALAYSLFMEDASGGTGVLCVRGGEKIKHLFGSLAERGDPRPLGISALALIVIGFWAAIPLFGRAKNVPVLPGKPLRERFLAEGRFYLKYGDLSNYAKNYGAENATIKELMNMQIKLAEKEKS